MKKEALEKTCYVGGAGAFGVFLRWLQTQVAFNDEGLPDASVFNVLVPLSILAGCAVMLVSVWLMPVYAMSRSETLGWRLLLMINMTPSIPAWSMETVGVLLLFFLALSNSANEASTLIAGMAGKESASGWVTLLLLLLLLPCAVFQFDAVLDTLSTAASFRGPVTLFIVLFLYIGGLLHRKEAAK